MCCSWRIWTTMTCRVRDFLFESARASFFPPRAGSSRSLRRNSPPRPPPGPPPTPPPPCPPPPPSGAVPLPSVRRAPSGGFGSQPMGSLPHGISRSGAVLPVTRHTSHVTRHTSHVTRHTSHVTRHTSHLIQAPPAWVSCADPPRAAAQQQPPPTRAPPPPPPPPKRSASFAPGTARPSASACRPPARLSSSGRRAAIRM
jgi:hypothetical protein